MFHSGESLPPGRGEFARICITNVIYLQQSCNCPPRGGAGAPIEALVIANTKQGKGQDYGNDLSSQKGLAADVGVDGGLEGGTKINSHSAP